MQLNYSVIYSDRKSLSISITREGEILVRAPHATPVTVIQRAVETHRDWIVKHKEERDRRNAQIPQLSDKEILALKKQARVDLARRVAFYAERMGISYGRITITSARTRYGSCSVRGDLAFSYRLMFSPPEARDYVVVHELAHRKEMNHSAAFYRIVGEVLPDYKQRKKRLI